MHCEFDPKSNDLSLRAVPNRENDLTILKSLHENKAGGESFCKNCNICQHQNSIKKGPSELHPIPIPDRIFGMWGIYLIGPLHLTEDGNVYMIVVPNIPQDG